MAAGTVEQPYLLRNHVADEPVFIVIYEGNPNEGETAVECCNPLHAGGTAPDGVATRMIPAHREAYVRVQKQTVQSGKIGDVYVGIENWIEGQGLEVAAAPRKRTGPTFSPPQQMTRYSTWRSPCGDISCGPSSIGDDDRRVLPAVQLSLKALRLYERLGLLRPIAVDERNGYRRYHESQLYTARLIVMLRLLEMPLSEVGKVVSASRTEGAEIIDTYWASVESRFAAQRQLTGILSPSVAASVIPAPELAVRERDVAEQTVLTSSGTSTSIS